MSKDNIEYRKGNLLDVESGIIVHGCNARGVMGSGVALSVKQKYKGAYQAYHNSYRHSPVGLTLGGVIYWRAPSSDLWIANAITQDNFGTGDKRYVNYWAIAKCFKEILGFANTYAPLVHFPKIGAGLGGGDWDIIQQIINDCDPDNQVKKVCWEL